MEILATLLLCFGFAQTPSSIPPIQDLVQIPVANAAEYQHLQTLLVDVDDHHAAASSGTAMAYATDAEQQLLQSLGIPYVVVIEDLQNYYAQRAARDLSLGGRAAVGSMGGFRTLAEIVSEMDRLAATYPAFVPRSSR